MNYKINLYYLQAGMLRSPKLILFSELIEQQFMEVVGLNTMRSSITFPLPTCHNFAVPSLLNKN